MKVRTLIGAALACLFLLGLAPGAQASQLKAEKYPATVSGGLSSGLFVIEFEQGFKTKCAGFELDGQLSAAQESLTATSIMTLCTLAGVGVPIQMNGCDWVLGTGAGSVDLFAGTLGIACPAGQAIAIAVSTCEIRIPAQTGLGAVSLENLTSATPKSKVAVAMNISNLTYEKAKDGASCPLAGTGTMTNGILTANLTLAGKEASGSNPLSILVG